MLSPPLTPPRMSTGSKERKILPKFCPPAEGLPGSGRREPPPPGNATPFIPPALPGRRGLPLRIAPLSAGARLGPREGRSGKVVRGPAAASLGRNPQVSATHRTDNQRPRVGPRNWNDKRVARKLPTSCGYAIVVGPQAPLSMGGPGAARGEAAGAVHTPLISPIIPQTRFHTKQSPRRSRRKCVCRGVRRSGNSPHF